jgi:DNA-directed RNA polymerase specialized sigma24 family protein
MCTLPDLEKILPLAARRRLARRLHTNESDILGQAYLLATTPAFRRLSLADRPRWLAAAVGAEIARELQPAGDVQVDDLADFIPWPASVEIERWRREEAPAAAVAGLPPRLREVVLLALAGRSTAEIAAARGVGERRARQLVVAAEAALNTMRV